MTAGGKRCCAPLVSGLAQRSSLVHLRNCQAPSLARFVSFRSSVYNPCNMQRKLIQIIGILWTIVYAAAIVWIYTTEPRSLKEAATNTQVAAGVYEINQEKFNSGLAHFRHEQFRAARDEWALADPAQKDPRTQFYIAYAFYPEGWGRAYFDNNLFKQGVEAVNRTINLAPNGCWRLTTPTYNCTVRQSSKLNWNKERKRPGAI